MLAFANAVLFALYIVLAQLPSVAESAGVALVAVGRAVVSREVRMAPPAAPRPPRTVSRRPARPSPRCDPGSR